MYIVYIYWNSILSKDAYGHITLNCQADEAKVDEELAAVLKNLRAAEKPMAFISQAALLPAMGLSQVHFN